MADDQDQSQKTEDPTQKRLDDASKKGDFPKSQEVTAWVTLAAATAALAFLSGPISRDVMALSHNFVTQPHNYVLDGFAAIGLLRGVGWGVLRALAFFAVLLVVAGLAGHLIQHMPVFSAEKMKPKLSKLSPLEGAKRVFGAQALVNFAKGLAKLTVVTLIIFFIVWPDRDKLAMLIMQDPVAILPLAKAEALKVMAGVLAALAVIAGLDFVWQRAEFMKRQRMSKQDIKEEHRQAEGDPLVKAKLRQIRQEKAHQRMMSAVPNATVVVANPTHYAVALKYERGQAGAPTCVAKGVDALALRIREVAEEAEVPVVENPPLARALYASVEVDEEIPLDHYKAVAEVIGFVFRQARRR